MLSLRHLFIVSIKLLCYAGVTFCTVPGKSEQLSQWSPLLSEVYTTLSSESYFPFSLETALTKGLDAFTHSIDEHSRFLGPNAYKELIKSTSGGFYGIGIELGPKRDDDEYLMILQVKPGSPAEKAGIQRYDRIIAIDGSSVTPLTIQENVAKLKSDTRFAPVTLDILRDKKGLITYTIKRDLVHDETCWASYLPEQNILYCAVTLFTQNVPDQLRTLLEKGLNKKPRGIILDLRDNTGGVLQAAVACAGLFLPKNSLVVFTKDRSGKTRDRYLTEQQQLVKQMPILILVNNYTASAAEILAQTLKIHSAHEKKGVSPYIFIVGTQTFGKGSVQEIRPVGNNCALKLTTALYYLPDGNSMQYTGITPDIIIKQLYPPSSEIKLLQKLYGKERPQEKETIIDKVKDREHDTALSRIKALKKDHQFTCACTLTLLLSDAVKTYSAVTDTHEKALTWLKKNFIQTRDLHPEKV